MRVSCFFVTVAIMLAEQASAAPILGLASLPLLNISEGRAEALGSTLHPLPLTKNLLDGSSNRGLVSTTLSTDIDNDSTLNTVTDLLRRGLPVLDTVGSLLNGVETVPLVGGLDAIAPVTKSITSEVGPLNGDLPELPKMTTGTFQVLPVSPLQLKKVTGSLLKRDSGLSSIPFLGSLPGAGSLGSIPGLSGLPSMPSIPSMGSMPSIPGMSSLPSIPGMSSLPSIPGMGSMPSIPGMSSLPSMPSLPSMGSIPGLSSVPGLGSMSSGGMPGLDSLTSML